MLENSNILLDKKEIVDSIITFKNDIDIQKLKSLYFSKSFSEIFSISRREISHSSFIAWILDNKENHQLSYFPIQKFLEIISLRCSDEKINLYSTFFNSILTDNYSIKSLETQKEKALGEYGRLDIYVETSICIDNIDYRVKIIIENKVESKENNDQTEAYFRYFEKNKLQNDINLYVYLNAVPSMELPDKSFPDCICKNFTQINYQHLVDYLLEPALNQNITDKTKFIIKEYLQSLSQPAINKNESKYKQQLIMALGKEERELLSKFWNQNEKLILSAMYANSINEDLDPETRAKNIEAFDSYSKGSGIGIKIQEVFSKLCKQNLLDNYVEKLCDPSYSKNNFNLGQSLLTRKTNDINCGVDEKGYPRYYKKSFYTIKGVDYLLNSQWTSKNSDKFEAWSNQLQTEITYGI